MKKKLVLKKHFMQIKVYALVALMLFSALVPLKAMAVDWNFFSNNDILFYDPTCADTTSPDNGDGTLTGKNNKEKIWCYLITKFKLSKGGAAGLMGNMQRESGFTPDKWQIGGYCDDKYSDSCGYGLVQWTSAEFKKTGPNTLWKFAGETFPDTSGKVGTLKTQLDYLYFTFTEWPGDYFTHMYNKLKQDILPKDAAFIYLQGYGQPSAPEGGETNQKGVGYAEDIYKELKDLPCGNATTTSEPQASGAKPKILIVPGHTGNMIAKHEYNGDPKIKDEIYGNKPELQDAWDVAQIVKPALEEKGYEVLMGKNNVDGEPYSWDRAKQANDKNVDLAFEIHTDSTSGIFGKNDGNKTAYAATWSQFEGGYRKAGTNGSGEPVPLSASSDVIKKSKKYAAKFTTARIAAGELNTVTMSDTNFYKPKDRVTGLVIGNITLVQLWSKVPWLYLEAGADASKNGHASGGITDAQKEIYAKGIINGVVASVPPGSGTAGDGCTDNSAGSGECIGGKDIVATALCFAWDKSVVIDRAFDTTHGREESRPEYVEAYDKYNVPGEAGYTDCGRYVATVMRASGVDPNYPQCCPYDPNWNYIKTHLEAIEHDGTTGKLLPGDIFLSPTHTLIYLGEKGGEGTNFRQASLHTEPPNAPGMISPGSYYVYRVKK